MLFPANFNFDILQGNTQAMIDKGLEIKKYLMCQGVSGMEPCQMVEVTGMKKGV